MSICACKNCGAETTGLKQKGCTQTHLMHPDSVAGLKRSIIGRLPKAKGHQTVAVTQVYGVPEDLLTAYSIVVSLATQKTHTASSTDEVKNDPNERYIRCVHIEGEGFELEVSMGKLGEDYFWAFVYDVFNSKSDNEAPAPQKESESNPQK